MLFRSLSDAETIEIIRGIENGIDVSVYCKEEFNAAQMKALRLGLEEKLDLNRQRPSQEDSLQKDGVTTRKQEQPANPKPGAALTGNGRSPGMSATIERIPSQTALQLN